MAVLVVRWKIEMNGSSLHEIRKRLESLPIEEIKRQLEPLMMGRSTVNPTLKSGLFVYRARVLDDDFSKNNGIHLSDITYPPADKCRMGRLNRNGRPLFYCSTGKEPLLFELDVQEGYELVISIWKTGTDGILNNIGYTDPVFKSLGAVRPPPTWTISENSNSVHVGGPVITMPEDDPISEVFTERINREDQYKYKLTAAIAEMHYEKLEGELNKFAGVLYPSMRMWANGDNLALLPLYVDAHLRFMKAIHVRVDSRDDTSFSITELDSAKALSPHGGLAWECKPPRIVLVNQRAKLTRKPG